MAEAGQPAGLVIGRSYSSKYPLPNPTGGSVYQGQSAIPAPDIPLPRVGDRLAVHPEWDAAQKAFAFYETTYAGGPGYKRGLDSTGEAILYKHDDLRESELGFKRRQRMATYKNHAKPIVKKFVEYVYRQDIERDSANERWVKWLQNIDGEQTELNPFVRRCMRNAVKLGRYYIGVDTNKPMDLGEVSISQARAMGLQMILVAIHPRNVLNWRRRNDALVEALVTYDDGATAVLWTPSTLTRIGLGKDGVVEAVEDPMPHTWGRLPIIEVAPFEGDSLIGDIAELSRDNLVLDSLLHEELYNATFTQRWVSGTDENSLQSALSGPGRIITMPNPDAKVMSTGGDPAQAATLQAAIDANTRDIYRHAGLKAEDPLQVGVAKSGVALRVEFNDLAALLSAIAEEGERVEKIIGRAFEVAGGGQVSPPKYPDKFGEPDVLVELNRTLMVLESDRMMPTAKLLESRRINGVLHPHASPEDQRTMASESRLMFGPEAVDSAAADAAALAKMTALIDGDDAQGGEQAAGE